MSDDIPLYRPTYDRIVWFLLAIAICTTLAAIGDVMFAPDPDTVPLLVGLV